MTAVCALLVLSSLVNVTRTYPYYFPYMNALGMGRPGYMLASDSNLDWNQAMPDVKQWAQGRGIQRLPMDYYGFNDVAASVPQAELWNCQRPATVDAGQWVVVSADMILDSHNCGWLLQYPHEELARGGMYAFHLPSPIPAAGTAGGPPLPAEQREFVGFPVDMRPLYLDLVRHPENLQKAADEMQAQFAEQMKKMRQK